MPVRINLPGIRNPAHPRTDVTIFSETTGAPCPSCCPGSGTGSPVECDCVFATYVDGTVPPFSEDALLINLPTFMASRYFLDVAGFADGGGTACDIFNGIIRTCILGSQGGGFTVWNSEPSEAFNGNALIQVLLYSENALEDHPAPHWAAYFTALCSGGTGFYRYKYSIDVADYNGCGSAVMTLESTDVDSCPPCSMAPATITISTDPTDKCNCNCGCFLNALDRAFPTSLYFRLYNIVTSPPLPPGTIFNATLAFPTPTNQLQQRGVGGISWGYLFEASGIGLNLANVEVACLCGGGGSTGVPFACGFITGGIFIVNLGGSSVVFFQFLDVFTGDDCGRDGACYFSGSVGGFFGGTADIIISCDPIP